MSGKKKLPTRDVEMMLSMFGETLERTKCDGKSLRSENESGIFVYGTVQMVDFRVIALHFVASQTVQMTIVI